MTTSKPKVRIKRDSLDNIIDEHTDRQLPDFKPGPWTMFLLKLMIVAFLIVGFALIAVAFIEPQSELDSFDRDDFNPVITYIRGA